MEQRLWLCSYQQMWKIAATALLVDRRGHAKKLQEQENSRFRVGRAQRGRAVDRRLRDAERVSDVLSKQGGLSPALKLEAFTELEHSGWLTIEGLASLQLQQEQERIRRRKFIAFEYDR